MLQFGNNHLQTFLQVLYAMTVETLENHRISLKKHPDHKTFFNSQIKTNISYIYHVGKYRWYILYQWCMW